jgi:hypothetical protein
LPDSHHQQRHWTSRDWGWFVFAFLFGFPGYCGYRLHRRWPVANPRPKPQPLGIEVFSPAVG